MSAAAEVMRRLFDESVRPVLLAGRERGVRYLEKRNRVVTSGQVDLKALGLAGDDRVHYKPTSWWTLRRILRRHTVSPDDVFLDLGSGKGRAVFQAARDYPFRRVVGVELSDVLTEIARENIERNQHRLRCAHVDLVVADVINYDIPDDATVVYCNNPFVGDVFAAATDKLLASYDRRKRRIRFIYTNPIEHDYLVGTGRFRPLRRLRGLRPGRDWARSNSTQMYEVLPTTTHPTANRRPRPV